jgi:hypothetical protein
MEVGQLKVQGLGRTMKMGALGGLCLVAAKKVHGVEEVPAWSFDCNDSDNPAMVMSSALHSVVNAGATLHVGRSVAEVWNIIGDIQRVLGRYCLPII